VSSARSSHHELRPWLTNGLAALVISGLGLGVAGATTLTGNHASTDPTADAAARGTQIIAMPVPAQPGPGAALAPQQKTPPALARAFSRRDAAETTSRTTQLRSAIVQERAAQRAEDLTKTAEAVTRSGQAKSSASREAELEAADQAIQATAERLAEQRRQRAEAARLAAERARKQAEATLRALARSAAEPTPRARTGSSPSAEPERSEPQLDQPKSVESKSVESDSVESEPVESEPGRSEPEPPQSSGGKERSGSSGGGSASPVPGAVIGSYFGQYGSWSRYHTGLDFRAGQGVPIKAVKRGVVLFAGNSGNWAGNHVAIKHGDGRTTMSSHMSSMAVSGAETVSAGQVIGYVGQTGRAFGAHLHFELYPAGVRFGDVYKAINPQPWLSANGVQTR